MSASKPRILFVYFTYTQQSRKLADAMGEVLTERGCEVHQAAIELTDKRYAERFSRFPLRHVYRDLLGMLPAQVRGATGEIRVPSAAQEGDYDLVVVGSPTWFFRTSVPVRSWLKSEYAGRILKGKRFAAVVVCRRYWSINQGSVKKLAAQRGGEYVAGTHFTFAGRQVRSLLSLISYFGHGEDNQRYLGVKIPPSNLKPDYREQARSFANQLADGLEGAGTGTETAASDNTPINLVDPTVHSTPRRSEP
jgi:menaquinone-dependent protoporphyrinogen IX oxidase